MPQGFKKNFRKFKPRAHRESAAGDGVQRLWGLHTVEEALRNKKRRHIRLVATENAWRKLEAVGRGIVQPEIVRPTQIDKILGRDTVHQGVFLESHPLPSLNLEDLDASGCLLALDQITDPHNVGAILRSAAAFDVKAVIMTERYSPQAHGVLGKSASGALEHVPLIFVKNLRQSLESAREMGFSVVGLDSEGAENLSELKLCQPLLLVMGAEGKGLRPIVRETCDHLARLDLPGAIKSLNVSNAAVLALYVANQKT